MADNGSDKATLYTGATPTSVSKASLVVNVTGAAPTGQVFNPDTSAFIVRDKKGHSGASVFIFDTENGTIDGWNPAVGAKGSTPALSSSVPRWPTTGGAKAVYKGLALAQASNGKPYLYATNFHSGRIEVYNRAFKRVSLRGGHFADPYLPAGYGPFGIAEVGGELYVTFAKQDAMRHDDVAGPGHGFVDVFSNDGAFVRLARHPWRAQLAVGSRRGAGRVRPVQRRSAGRQLRERPHQRLQPGNGAHLGQLRRANGRPIVIDGLWGLRSDGNAAKTNQLIFSAGPDGEAHGLLGKIVAKY